MEPPPSLVVGMFVCLANWKSPAEPLTAELHALEPKGCQEPFNFWKKLIVGG